MIEDDLRDLKALVLQGFERLEGKLRDESVETREYVDLRFGQVQTEVGELRTEVGELRTEVGELRTEMRTEFGDVRTELGDVRTELGNLRTEVGGLQTDVAGLQAGEGSLRTEIVRQRQLIGTEFAKATSHADTLYGKLRDQIALQSKRVTRIERRDRRRR